METQNKNQKKVSRLYGSFEQKTRKEMEQIRTEIFDKYGIFLDVETVVDEN